MRRAIVQIRLFHLFQPRPSQSDLPAPGGRGGSPAHLWVGRGRGSPPRVTKGSRPRPFSLRTLPMASLPSRREGRTDAPGLLRREARYAQAEGGPGRPERYTVCPQDALPSRGLKLEGGRGAPNGNKKTHSLRRPVPAELFGSKMRRESSARWKLPRTQPSNSKIPLKLSFFDSPGSFWKTIGLLRVNPWGLPNPFIVSEISLIGGVAEKYFHVWKELLVFSSVNTGSL